MSHYMLGYNHEHRGSERAKRRTRTHGEMAREKKIAIDCARARLVALRRIYKQALTVEAMLIWRERLGIAQQEYQALLDSVNGIASTDNEAEQHNCTAGHGEARIGELT
jgi:hypothetical protein